MNETIPQYDLVIIGNSTAAVGAIEAIRSQTKDLTIALISSEPEHTYSRPLITYYLAGKVEESNVYYRPPEFYKANNVDTRLGVSAESIDSENSQIHLDNGETVGYGSLLIAAGGEPIAPPIPGIDRPGVFFMNTMDDARRAKGWLAHTSRAVVVGAGLTGLKTAEALSAIGQQVTVVEFCDRVLPTVLDATASGLARKAFEKHSVEIITDVRLTEILGSEDTKDVAFVQLSTGERLACETVFVTVGVKPRLGIVAGTDVAVNRGILVDEHMRTNVPNIYAAGDIAEAFEQLSGDRRVLPILPNAHIGGRIAGLNVVGVPAKFNLGMSVNSVSFFGETFMSAGFANAPEDEKTRVISAAQDSSYRRFAIQDGKLVGMIITGEIDRTGLITGMMRAGMDVSGLESELLSGDIGLISLPEGLLDERIHGCGRNWL